MVRHSVAAWLGVRYGHHVLEWWARVSAKWGEPVLIALWCVVLVGAGLALWKLYRTSKAMELKPLKALKKV